MSLRTTACRAQSAIAATSARAFSTTQPILAGGKGPKKSTLNLAGKKKQIGFGAKNKLKRGGSLGRIVHGLKISYAMASDPPDLSDFGDLPAVIAEDRIGRPATFSKAAFDAISTFGLPRRLDKELTSPGGPVSVVRQITADMTGKLQTEASSSSKESRYMLTGPQGSGKSMAIVQTVAQALASGWIVLYVPQAASWTDGSLPYQYNSSTQQFDQETLAASILDQLGRVNGKKLSEIKIGDQDIPSVIKSAIAEEKQLVETLDQVLEALAKQEQFPVLLAVDDVHAFFRDASYWTPQYERIQAYNLSGPRMALDFISGRKSFARGMVVSAYSHSSPGLPLPATFLYGLELPSPQPITAYENFEPTHLAHATSGIKKIELPFGMTPKEAVGLFEIFSRKKMVPRASDEVFMGGFTASSGNPKELGREWLADKLGYYRFDAQSVRV